MSPVKKDMRQTCCSSDPFKVQKWPETNKLHVQSSHKPSLTHAVLHHHEATLIAFEAFTLKAARHVDAGAMATEIW